MRKFHHLLACGGFLFAVALPTLLPAEEKIELNPRV